MDLVAQFLIDEWQRCDEVCMGECVAERFFVGELLHDLF